MLLNRRPFPVALSSVSLSAPLCYVATVKPMVYLEVKKGCGVSNFLINAISDPVRPNMDQIGEVAYSECEKKRSKGGR